MDEDEAIAQLKAGNIEGLKALVDLYQVQAVQAATLIIQDRAAAEDIVQTIFLRSFERIKQFDSTRPFKPWFLRMVINEAIKEANRQKHNLSLDGAEQEAYRQLIACLDASNEAPEDIVQRNELRQEIRKALKGLSPQQRASIVLRYYLGYNERELSAWLNCAPGTVRWHLSMARQRLRTMLAPLLAEDK
jgi:RNA polymerase sigma-70 factor (ECF subfamily)